jgi:hypothetical protein
MEFNPYFTYMLYSAMAKDDVYLKDNVATLHFSVLPDIRMSYVFSKKIVFFK